MSDPTVNHDQATGPAGAGGVGTKSPNTDGSETPATAANTGRHTFCQAPAALVRSRRPGGVLKTYLGLQVHCNQEVHGTTLPDYLRELPFLGGRMPKPPPLAKELAVSEDTVLRALKALYEDRWLVGDLLIVSGRYVNVPDAVLFSDATPEELRLWCAYADLGRLGTVAMGTREIAKMLGAGRHYVINNRAKLVGKKLLTVEETMAGAAHWRTKVTPLVPEPQDSTTSEAQPQDNTTPQIPQDGTTPDREYRKMAPPLPQDGTTHPAEQHHVQETLPLEKDPQETLRRERGEAGPVASRPALTFSDSDKAEMKAALPRETYEAMLREEEENLARGTEPVEMSCFGAKDKSRATEQGVRDEKLLTNGTSGPRPAPSALYAAVRAQIATGAEIPAWAVAKAVAALEAADRAPSWVLGVGEALAETFGPVANRFGLIDRVASLVALPAEATGESVRSAVSTWRALNSARASALQESWLVKDYRQLVAGAAAAAKEHARRHGSTTAPEDQTEEERFQEMTKGFKGRVVRIGERQRAA